MSDFAKAIETVITIHEGGFQNRVDDPGNWTPAGELKGTKFGISARSFPDVDIEALTLTEAEELYRKVWGHFAALTDQRVLTKVLDLAVNMQWAGHGPATVILQRGINQCGGHVDVDGVFGPITAAAANETDPEWLLKAIVGPSAGALRRARGGQARDEGLVPSVERPGGMVAAGRGGGKECLTSS